MYLTTKDCSTYPSMSGVSDISCRALVMCGSSAKVETQELTHSIKYTVEITLNSIFLSFTQANLPFSFSFVSLNLLLCRVFQTSVFCLFFLTMHWNVISPYRSSSIFGLFLITASPVISAVSGLNIISQFYSVISLALKNSTHIIHSSLELFKLLHCKETL